MAGPRGQDSALFGTTTHTLPWSLPALQCPGLGQSQTQRGSGGGPPSWPQEGGMGHSPPVTTVSQTEARPCRGGSRPNSCCDLEQNPSPLWALLAPCPFSQPKLPRDPSSEGLEAAQAPVLALRAIWPSQDTAVLQVVLAFSQTKQFPVVIPEPVWGFCRHESFGGRFFQFSNITWWSCSQQDGGAGALRFQMKKWPRPPMASKKHRGHHHRRPPIETLTERPPDWQD